MRHAGADALQRLSPLLARLRELPGLNERKPGIFYQGSRAFLHFHEHDGALFADVRLDGEEFTRLPCSRRSDQNLLLRRVRDCLETRARS